ncbi:putative cytochrome P450 monooxygenase [Aspergillus taichungensis]|uniref:Putative cytochrome P450 monooxygenase n=1 Tax=Aspergillus taichungensis TaxID=482145 RepID=A0A2J5HWX1_9EURO|nr:putative cytochrome P450 monooxygenase [Aspergillus taichungensis]
MIEIPLSAVYVALAAYAYYFSSLSQFLLLSFAATILKTFYSTVLYPEYFTPLKQIPTPPNRSWIIGNSRSLLDNFPFTAWARWAQELPNNGLLRIYMPAGMERLTVTNAKALSEMLVQRVYDFQKPELSRMSLARAAGDTGLLLLEGDEHKRQRRNLMPAFSYRHIKDLYPIFWSKSIEMVNLMKEDLQKRPNPSDNVVKIGAWATRAALDIIGVAGMDHDFEALRDPNNDLAKAYEAIVSSAPPLTQICFILFVVLGLGKLAIKAPLKHNRDISASADLVRTVVRNVITEGKKKRDSSSSGSITPKVDILSVALESGAFTDDELVDQIMTFLAAGHETTATALQWATYALCKHPDVQTRLREEVRARLSPSAPIAAPTLDSLHYLNAVCSEVLRFYPSVPATIRVATRNMTLVGQHIPKGTILIVSPQIINHLPELWGDDADEFNPERWMGPGKANTGGATSNYAFMTFLHGSRGCIGQGFARAELACMVAAIVARFHMELVDPDAEVKVRTGATVCPVDGVMAKLTPVAGW